MSDVKQGSGRKRVLSGMRPTGRLHLGNYMGALYNWVRLQNQYDCYFFIADYHALTTDYADPSRLLANVFEIAVDFLAAGLDPKRCTIFVQSHVPQHAELNLLFGMFTPLSWLERVPTYKDQQEQLRDKDLATYGFLGYPLLQSADILLYQPDFVPVGQDQVAHVELTREVARKFNQLYSPTRVALGEGGAETIETDPAKLILPEPQVLLTPSPKLPGIDGRKMSKSYGNSILLSDSPEDVEEKMGRMTNGGQRNPQTLPGDPEICPVGDMHRLFSNELTDATIRQGCRTAAIGCPQCKKRAADSINEQLSEIRLRRLELERDPARVWRVLDEGALRARARAEETLVQVREATGLSRTLKPVPQERRNLNGLKYDEPHDLRSRSESWGIDQVFRARALGQHWRSRILPSEIAMKEDADRVYITRKGKRALVGIAREAPEGSFSFTAKLKTYELLVLLCWDHDLQLYDYVVPQAAFVAAWTELKRTPGRSEVTFTVQMKWGRATLNLPGAKEIDIKPYRGDYGPLV